MCSLRAGLRKLSVVSLGEGLSLRGLRRPSLRPVVEAVLIVLLLVQAGRLVWLFAAPAPQAATQARPLPDVDLGVLTRFDAFFRNGGSGEAASASDGGGLTLFGVRADGAGGGSAIIGLADGRQVSVGTGEEVEPGLTLSAVAPDHVMLSRGGAPFRLDFPDMAGGVAPTSPAPPPAAEPAAQPAASAEGGVVVDPQRLIAQAGLRPRIQGLGIKGLTVSASGDGGELRNAGLRSGDVILSVNGTALNSPQALAALRGQLADAPSAQIQFERDGQVRSTTLRTRP